MKILYVVLFILFCLTCHAQKKELELNGKTYALTFSDEFNTVELDTNRWAYRTDSKHWSTQLKRNVVLKNGFLLLNVKKDKLKINTDTDSYFQNLKKIAFSLKT